MSFPNLESLINELSKFGAHLKRSFGETETPKDPPHGTPNDGHPNGSPDGTPDGVSDGHLRDYNDPLI